MTSTIAPALSATQPVGAFGRLVDLDRIAENLSREVAWPPALEGAALSLRRLWAGRGSRISFELLITPRTGEPDRPLVLQGGFGSAGGGPAADDTLAEVRLGRIGLCGLAFRNERDGLWLCSADRDPRLAVLGDLLDPSKLIHYLPGHGESAFPEVERTGLTSELIAWRAGRRAMLRVRPNGPRNGRGVCVKVFRRPPGWERSALHDGLGAYLNRASGGRVRLPPLLDVRQTPALMITQEIDAAEPLTRSAGDLSAAAETLVWLHAAPFRLSVAHTPRAELQTVCRWSRLFRAAAPEAHERLRSMVRALTGALGGLGWEDTGPVHRDYYNAQLLRRGEVVWLTDLDTLTRGHPEVDVATFAAHLALDVLLEGAPPRTAAAAAAGFADRYAALGGQVVPVRWDFYLACALLRLGALHGARGRPVEIVNALWNLAEQRLRATSWT